MICVHLYAPKYSVHACTTAFITVLWLWINIICPSIDCKLNRTKTFLSVAICLALNTFLLNEWIFVLPFIGYVTLGKKMTQITQCYVIFLNVLFLISHVKIILFALKSYFETNYMMTIYCELYYAIIF